MRGTTLRHDVMPSPNFDHRAHGLQPDILLLHYTGMASAEMALKRLCDPVAKVSCHYLVHEDGRIVQMVDEDARAWHAGVSSWKGVGDINSRSIGIEIHNIGHNGDYPDFTDAQMVAVTNLCTDILMRHPIAPCHVLAHSDVAPGRKTDPGEKFDWHRLWQSGIGHWVHPAKLLEGSVLSEGDSGPLVKDLQHLLATYGFGVNVNGQFDGVTRISVEAFQRHFRSSKVDGVADTSTLDTLKRLLATVPQRVHGTV